MSNVRHRHAKWKSQRKGTEGTAFRPEVSLNRRTVPGSRKQKDVGEAAYSLSYMV